MGSRGPVSVKMMTACIPSGLGKPIAPKWLTAPQRKMFGDIAQRTPWITPIDGGTLARYCLLWARWREADAQLDGARSKGGDEKAQARGRRHALGLAAELLALEVALGLTPAARARLGIPGQGTAAMPTLKARFFKATE